MEYIVHGDGYVTLLGEVVGECFTDDDGRAVVQFFDAADMPKGEAWFSAYIGL